MCCYLTLVGDRAKEGHPTQFLRVLHYAMFGCSGIVREYMFSNGVDRDIVHLNDLKFFKTLVHILVSHPLTHFSIVLAT